MNIRKAELNDLLVINSFLIDMGMLEISSDSFLLPYRRIYVLEHKKNICGFICFLVASGEIELEAIYIDSQFRGCGYSFKLITAMFEDAKSFQCHSIFLEVEKTNEIAKKLYIKNGFFVIYERKNYYKNNDALVMKKEIR